MEEELFKSRHFEQAVILLSVLAFALQAFLSRSARHDGGARTESCTYDEHALDAALRPRVKKMLEPHRPQGWAVMAQRRRAIRSMFQSASS